MYVRSHEGRNVFAHVHEGAMESGYLHALTFHGLGDHASPLVRTHIHEINQ